MSTEKRPKLPSTDEVALIAAERHGVDHLAGTILLDRYRLIAVHGSGGAAVVYRAEHIMMQKPVAVKILRPEHSTRHDFVQRFLAEGGLPVGGLLDRGAALVERAPLLGPPAAQRLPNGPK